MHVRMRRYAADTGHGLIGDFSAWARANSYHFETEPGDMRIAIEILGRFELKLRAPDALHLAICQRAGAALLTFDDDQAAAAAALGIPLAA